MRFGVDRPTGRVEPRDDNAREPVRRVPLLAARLSVSRSRVRDRSRVPSATRCGVGDASREPPKGPSYHVMLTLVFSPAVCLRLSARDRCYPPDTTQDKPRAVERSGGPTPTHTAVRAWRRHERVGDLERRAEHVFGAEGFSASPSERREARRVRLFANSRIVGRGILRVRVGEDDGATPSGGRLRRLDPSPRRSLHVHVREHDQARRSGARIRPRARLC